MDDPTFGPIPGDEDLVELGQAIKDIGAEHIHADDISTFGASMMNTQTGEAALAAVIELRGRYNQRTTRGEAKAILTLEAAVTLLETLHHTVTALIDAGATLDGRRCRMCGCTSLNACAGGCSWAPDHPDGGQLCSRCAASLGLPTS